MQQIKNMKRAILVILDGWGITARTDDNAAKAARTPVFDNLHCSNPHTLLDASGPAVGLPDGQMGNSEVGHMNIGAGRVVRQELVRINDAVRDGSIHENTALRDISDTLSRTGGDLHIMGLVSPGGIHSSMEHLYALLEYARDNVSGVVYVHAFLDGRDTPPKSAETFVEQLEKRMDDERFGSIATVAGRFYAMDRDERWERIAAAYDALTTGEGYRADSGLEAVREAYARGETDEFVKPTVVIDDNNAPRGIIKDGDATLFFNFRADRAREMSMALNFDDFDGFTRQKRVALAAYVTMTRYREDFPFPVLFAPLELTRILGEEISRAGGTQLRIAETEKYAHVTFFFNGGREAVFDGEERILVPSPKVETYDLQPEMSAPEVTDRLLAVMERYDLVVLNYANPDMVGHTGDFDAAVRAVETVDECLGRVCEKASADDRVVFITADHGNVEKMRDEKTGSPHTAHTMSQVPFIMVNGPRANLRTGKLGDIAPTIMRVMGVPVPDEMIGSQLF